MTCVQDWEFVVPPLRGKEVSEELKKESRKTIARADLLCEDFLAFLEKNNLIEEPPKKSKKKETVEPFDVEKSPSGGFKEICDEYKEFLYDKKTKTTNWNKFLHLKEWQYSLFSTKIRNNNYGMRKIVYNMRTMQEKSPAIKRDLFYEVNRFFEMLSQKFPYHFKFQKFKGKKEWWYILRTSEEISRIYPRITEPKAGLGTRAMCESIVLSYRVPKTRLFEEIEVQILRREEEKKRDELKYHLSEVGSEYVQKRAEELKNIVKKNIESGYTKPSDFEENPKFPLTIIDNEIYNYSKKKEPHKEVFLKGEIDSPNTSLGYFRYVRWLQKRYEDLGSPSLDIVGLHDVVEALIDKGLEIHQVGQLLRKFPPDAIRVALKNTSYYTGFIRNFGGFIWRACEKAEKHKYYAARVKKKIELGERHQPRAA